MKKVLTTGLLAIALIAMSQQQASAWINAQFGVNVNLGWQSGDNCFCWGAWHNGPCPGPNDYHHGHHGGAYAAPTYSPYGWTGQPSYPMPAFDTFSMAPSQYAQPNYMAPTYYYYAPASYYYGR